MNDVINQFVSSVNSIVDSKTALIENQLNSLATISVVDGKISEALSHLIVSYEIRSDTNPYTGRTFQTPVILFKKHPVDYGINLTINYTLAGENKSVSDTILIGPQDSILSINGILTAENVYFDEENDKILDVVVEADSYNEIIVHRTFNCAFDVIKLINDRTTYMYDGLTGRFNYLFMASGISWALMSQGVERETTYTGRIIDRPLSGLTFPSGRIFTYTYEYTENGSARTASGTYSAPFFPAADDSSTPLTHINSTGPMPEISHIRKNTNCYVIAMEVPNGITLTGANIELVPLPDEHWDPRIKAPEARIAAIERLVEPQAEAEEP